MRHPLFPIIVLMVLGIASCDKEKEKNPTEGNDTIPAVADDTTSIAVNGRLPGLFSVSESQQVYFSQGNLQWSASGSHVVEGGDTLPGTWRFATHQYDMVGSPSQCNGSEAASPYNAYPGNVAGSDNAFIAEDYAGWIDLFGWATSGYNGALPYSTSLDNSVYGFGGNCGFRPVEDWGSYNAISNGGNAPSLWRTLLGGPLGEWNYLLSLRSASTVNGTPDARYATICLLKGSDRIPGLLLFPDTFSWPSDAGEAPSNINAVSGSRQWSELPAYTLSQFAALEKAGCVFLPAAGSRLGTDVQGVGHEGNYWSSYGFSSEVRHDQHSYYLCIQPNRAKSGEGYLITRCHGLSVRLIQEKK